MTNYQAVLYLERRILALLPVDPNAMASRAWEIRTFGEQLDPVQSWLRLRVGAFGTSGLAVWDERDFAREFLRQPWWRPDLMWFVSPRGEEASTPIGTATLMCRSTDPSHRAHLHWLLVAPAWRRRGIATMLVDVVEHHARQLGYDALHVETLANWTEAVAFYARCGFTERASSRAI